jgi:phage shock protein PspC (stress-responsive transcriptional regulator)
VCGIFGAVSLTGAPLRAQDAVRCAGDALHHRGPDGYGFLDNPIAVLGSRRLSIVDLSTAADQPFTSPDGRYWLVCNGEIYNAPELRRRYENRGYPFRSSHSDVETMVPLFVECGEAALDEIGPVQSPGPAAPPPPEPARALQQVSEGAVVSGVCQGLARYFGLDVTLLRIFAVLLVFLSGGGMILVYLALMLLLPYAPLQPGGPPVRKIPAKCREWVEFLRAKLNLATS